MTIKPFLKAIAALAISGLMFSASANSVSFDMDVYGPEDVNNGQISVNINYDFSDFAMFGGGFDVVYDASVIEFVSYTQAELPDDAQAPASPVGSHDADNSTYVGAGIGTFDFINGMSSAGTVGTLLFDVVGTGGDAGCGVALCLVANGINPLVSLAGADVTADLLAGGSAAVVIPVPAAVWFLLSGLGALLGFGRKKSA